MTPTRDSSPDFRQKAARLPLSVLLSVLIVTGCETRKASEPPPPTETPPIERYVDPAVLTSLLDAAEAALGDDQLNYPEEGSAVALYREVLSIDPGNSEAVRGLERVVERYVAMALEAAERGQLARGRSMLARARLVDPEHAAIEPTARQIQLLSDASRTRMTLNREGLDNRAAEVSASLAELGGSARQDNCRARIYARNDAEGRWIYQQMSQAPGANRIRASFEIASPPQVEVMCFQPPAG